MTTTATVGGITFSNEPTPDSDGITWVMSRLDGWHGGVGVDSPRLSRQQGHGTFAQRAYRQGRLVVIEGAALCDSRSVAAVAQRKLSALLADGSFGDLLVMDVDVESLTASVQLGAAPDVDWSLRGDVVRFQLPLYAPDPLRYGDPIASTAVFPTLVGGLEYDLYTDGSGTDLGYLDYGVPSETGRVVLSNPGTADVPVTIEVIGPVPSQGFDIIQVGTGKRLTFEDPVGAGSSLVMDGATGAVVIDGTADRAGRLTWRDWPIVPAGGSIELLFSPRGPWSAATMTAVYRPGWW